MGTDVVELRAGVIIGSGSASFEMLRYLVEVVPVMVTPKWTITRCRPIAISDIIELPVLAVSSRTIQSRIYDAEAPTWSPTCR